MPKNRRDFLKASAGTAALGAASYRVALGANERIGAGVIGYGLIGKRHVATFRQLADVGLVVSVRMQSVGNVMPGFGRGAGGEPPEGLDWNLWLGPAPQRPYDAKRCLYHFRWFWDYSGGQMTNLGAHHLDIVDWILGLD